MEGWRREMYFDETGVPWVLPSPNIPTLDSAIVYPGTVLFEGTNISEGRGTTRPFELVGAPWIDAESFRRFAEPPGSGGRRGSGPPCSSRRFTSTPERTAAGARSTCSIAGRSGRSRPGSRCSRPSGPAGPTVSPGAIRRTNTSTTSCPSTSWPARPLFASKSTPACQAARSPDRGDRKSSGSWKCAAAIFSTDFWVR